MVRPCPVAAPREVREGMARALGGCMASTATGRRVASALALVAVLAAAAGPVRAAEGPATPAADTSAQAAPQVYERELVSASGKIHKHNPFAKALGDYQASDLREAAAWAKAHGTPIVIRLRPELPPAIEKAADTYVDLAGRGHPDALLHGLMDKSFTPPHTPIASPKEIAEFLDANEHEVAAAIGPSAATFARQRQAITSSTEMTEERKTTELHALDHRVAEAYLGHLWRTVQDYRPEHPFVEIHAAGANGETPAEVQKLDGNVRRLGLDAAVQRHVIQRALTNKRIEGVPALAGTMMGITAGTVALAHVSPEFAAVAAYGLDDMLAVPADAKQVKQTEGTRAAARYAARTTAIGLTAVGVLVKGGSLAHHLGEANPHMLNGAAPIVGRSVNAAANGVASTILAKISFSQARRVYVPAYVQNLKDGKIPGTVPSLMFDESLQASLKRLKSDDSPARVLMHVKAHYGVDVRLSAHDEATILQNGLRAVRMPSERDMLRHINETLIDPSPMTWGQRYGWAAGAAAGAAVSFASDGNEGALPTVIGENLASQTPALLGLGRWAKGNVDPVGEIHRSVNTYWGQVTSPRDRLAPPLPAQRVMAAPRLPPAAATPTPRSAAPATPPTAPVATPPRSR